MTPIPRLIAASASNTCRIVLPDPVAPRRSDMTARNPRPGTNQLALPCEPDRDARRTSPTRPFGACATRASVGRASSDSRGPGLAGPGRLRHAGRPHAARHRPRPRPPRRVGADLGPPAEQRRAGNRSEHRKPAHPGPPAPADEERERRARDRPADHEHAPVSTRRARCTIGSSGTFELTAPCVIGTS